MDELSPEDNLRLNVLLANKPLAIRINESSLTVQGLMPDGERELRLNPICREELYLRRVRELISGHVLGSPGGYPVYLKRWTRMGSMRDESLEQLLLLAEPEAVVAAVCSKGLTDELARRAWWCIQDAENARHMLANQSVVIGSMGPVLAEYLVEHLPFETEPEVMIDTVRLILQPGLLSEGQREGLWKKSGRRNAYVVGFLLALPDDIPSDSAPYPQLAHVYGPLDGLAQQGNGCAGLLLRVFSAQGQAFLAAVKRVLSKPANQEVVSRTLDGLCAYFAAARPDGLVDLTLDELQQEGRDALESNPELYACVELLPDLEQPLIALRVLSGVGYGILRPYLIDSSAIGSLMRRKLEPVITPLLGYLAELEGR